MPVQLLAGELDAKFVGIAKHMAMKIPHSQLRILPQAGHATHFEQPQAFVAAVDCEVI
jgi:2-succinyl-6-hydroxy-2,4-cyclohexadiene-1-carboxylate synthase